MESASLEDCISDLGVLLYRDAEVDAPKKVSSGLNSLFTWRKSSKKEEAEVGLSKKVRQSGGKKGSEAGLPCLVLAEKLLHHKTSVIRVVVVPVEPLEIWSLDEGGVVVRWPFASPEKGPRTCLSQFTVGNPVGRAMVVCGKNVWISCGDVTEIRDFKGRLMWKITEAFFSFAEHGSSAESVWCAGKDGMLSLFKHENAVSRVQLNFRPVVGALVVCTNNVSNGSEVWTSQGRVISVVDEVLCKVLVDLPDAVESKVNTMACVGSNVWMACESGKIVRFDVASRSMLSVVAAHEDRCSVLLFSPSRLITAGVDRSIRLFDAESGASTDVFPNAHEGQVQGAVYVEVGGKTQLWSCGADKAVSVWAFNATKKLTREESEELEESEASNSVGDGSKDKSTSSSSPRFAHPPNIQNSPKVVLPSLTKKTSIPSHEMRLSTDSDVVVVGGGEDGFSDEDDKVLQSEESVSLTASTLKKRGKKRVLSKIHVAIQEGSMEKLRAAMQAVEAKCSSDAERLEARKKALDRRGPNRRTPLHLAAANGNLEMVELLVNWGANLGAKDKLDLYAINLVNDTGVKAYLLQQYAAAGIDAGLGKNASSGAGAKPSHSRTKSVQVGSKKRLDKKRSGHGSSNDLTKLKVESASLASSMLDRSIAAKGPPPGKYTPAQVAAAVRIQAHFRMRLARAEASRLVVVRTRRANIVIEMVKTEETYVKTLDVLVNKIRVAMSTQSFRTSAGVSEQDLKVIFPASLSMLLSAHHSWLGQLRERQQAWSPQQCVGDLYLQLSPYLKMYIVYVSNFELSTLKIRELRKKENSKFVELVHEVFVNLNDPTNDLASMLVTPVQRIPRYVMMLKDLLKNTSTQHPDYNNLLRAVKIMTDTTVLVDRKAEDAKNAQKVLEVADLISECPTSIVQPNRKWVRDGPLGLVVSAKDVRPRYLFLFTDVLVLCQPVLEPKKTMRRSHVEKEKEKEKETYRYHREMSLLAASIQSIRDEDLANAFVVKSPKLAFILQAANAQEKSAWMKGILAVIETRKEGNNSRLAASSRGGSLLESGKAKEDEETGEKSERIGPRSNSESGDSQSEK